MKYPKLIKWEEKTQIKKWTIFQNCKMTFRANLKRNTTKQIKAVFVQNIARMQLGTIR